jgi:hypothetical protein
VWKATQILRMLTRYSIATTTGCEVGCGAGEALKTLQKDLSDHCRIWGYDVFQSMNLPLVEQMKDSTSNLPISSESKMFISILF